MSEQEIQTGNGWSEWSKHVLIELSRLNSVQAEIKEELTALSTKLVTLTDKLEGRHGVIDTLDEHGQRIGVLEKEVPETVKTMLDDHEVRLRKMEKIIWRAVGGISVFVLIIQIVSQLAK